jgi:hypothetical protein
MGDSNEAEVPEWIRKLDITDRATGEQQAHASWSRLIAAGQKVLGTGMEYQVEHTVLSGFLAKAQGLHEGAVAAIRADNPYAAFTLLRGYAENAAGILYVKDHPGQLDKFWQLDSYGVSVGKITSYAVTRFDNFRGIYSELSKYAHPMALSVLASSQVTDGQTIRWRSAPQFKSDGDAVIACAWVVELATATAYLLVEFAKGFGLLPDPKGESAAGQTGAADR